MQFSEQWLREWVNPSVDSQQLAGQLTQLGLEVEALQGAAMVLEKVVIGLVESVEPHPDARRLNVCRVQLGDGGPQIIVCGAPNVAPGMKVAAVLPGGRLGDIKIKKAKLRGVTSNGMICSAEELGLTPQAPGTIMSLPVGAPVGTPLVDYLQLDDHVFTLGITPNRGDCLSLRGIAREVACAYELPVHSPQVSETEVSLQDSFPVEIVASEGCPYYLGRVITLHDAPGESPLWLQERLRRAGLRSVDPIVDITNYVALELGQPLHVFDLDTLSGGIVVRRAQAQEPLTLLDGQEISLRETDLVVAHEQGPLALAGVMGGLASAVTHKTRRIFLESAHFTPHAVFGRARDFGLQSQAAYRFERGVDPTLPPQALARATQLILSLMKASVGPVVCAGEPPKPKPAMTLRQARIEQLLGIELPVQRVSQILKGLDMAHVTDPQGWQVTPPSHRFDIAQEIDLVEEVARVYGYDHIPTQLPQAPLTTHMDSETQVTPWALRHALVQWGYQEVISYSFVSEALQASLDPQNPPLALANPIGEQRAVMRTSLWPGLVEAALYNMHRQQTRGRLFEIGVCFLPGASGELLQAPMLAGLAWGDDLPEQWGAAPQSVDFFHIKNHLLALWQLLPHGQSLDFVEGTHPALQPGQSANLQMGPEEVGYLGALHPAAARRLDLKQPVYVFEILLMALQQGQLPQFKAYTSYPHVRRDVAMVVDKTVPNEEIFEVIKQSAGELLASVRLFDVYQGEGIPSEKKSVAMGLTWQHASRTLTDAEVTQAMTGVITALEQHLGALLRN